MPAATLNRPRPKTKRKDAAERRSSPVWAAQEAGRTTDALREVAGQIDVRLQLLSANDLMSLLRLSRTTILDWDRRGLIPPRVRNLPGGKPRWFAADIIAWLQTGCPQRQNAMNRSNAAS